MKQTVYCISCAVVAALIALPAFAREASKEEAACLNAYHKVHDGLAKDDLTGAQKAATELAEKALLPERCYSRLRASWRKRFAGERAQALHGGQHGCIRQLRASKAVCLQLPDGEGRLAANRQQESVNPYGQKMPNCGELENNPRPTAFAGRPVTPRL
jgi:hypothetical protein